MVMVLISSVDTYHDKDLILLDLGWLVLVGISSKSESLWMVLV